MITRIEGAEFEKVKELKAQGLREFQAVAQVLGISEDKPFVVTSLGTSSNTKDGYLVRFI